MIERWPELSSSEDFANFLIRNPDVAKHLSDVADPLRRFAYDAVALMPEESWMGMIVFKTGEYAVVSICLLTRRENLTRLAQSFDSIEKTLEYELEATPHKVNFVMGYTALRDGVEPRGFMDAIAEKNQGYVMRVIPTAPLRRIQLLIDEAAKHDMLPPGAVDAY